MTELTWIDWLAVGLMAGGGFFSLIAGLGVLRMQDVFMRMHASTKAGTLGVGMICGAVALELGGASAVKAVAVIFFILFTAPVGAHLIARAAWRARIPLWHPEGHRVRRADFICEDERL